MCWCSRSGYAYRIHIVPIGIYDIIWLVLHVYEFREQQQQISRRYNKNTEYILKWKKRDENCVTKILVTVVISMQMKHNGTEKETSEYTLLASKCMWRLFRFA